MSSDHESERVRCACCQCAVSDLCVCYLCDHALFISLDFLSCLLRGAGGPRVGRRAWRTRLYTPLYTL